MSSLDNLKKRIEYRGGGRQVDRMIDDKRRSLQNALFNSYQSATAVMEDGREFRCLINPNKISMELDDKILSIPFEDICLNKARPDGGIQSTGKEPTGIHCGSVVQWKENETRWIVYSQYLQEIAYFRGQMRQCEKEPLVIGDKSFYYYLKGPDEKGIDWQKSKHLIFNDLNYTVEIYISLTTETNQFFQRLAKVKLPFKNLDGEIEYKPFEVQAVDKISTEGILTAYLKEDYSNVWEEGAAQLPEEEEENIPEEDVSVNPRIVGPTEVYPFDTIIYSLVGATGGKWLISNQRAKIISQTSTEAIVEIVTGKSGSVSLIYRIDGVDDIVFNIKILSL